MENKRSVTVVAALVREGNKFLIGQRPEGKARAGMWEFIGGKTEPNETNEEALIRECREEIGVTVEVGTLFMDVLHDYPDLFVHLFVYNARLQRASRSGLSIRIFAGLRPGRSTTLCSAPQMWMYSRRSRRSFLPGEQTDAPHFAHAVFARR